MIGSPDDVDDRDRHRSKAGKRASNPQGHPGQTARRNVLEDHPHIKRYSTLGTAWPMRDLGGMRHGLPGSVVTALCLLMIVGCSERLGTDRHQQSTRITWVPDLADGRRQLAEASRCAPWVDSPPPADDDAAGACCLPSSSVRRGRFRAFRPHTRAGVAFHSVSRTGVLGRAVEGHCAAPSRAEIFWVARGLKTAHPYLGLPPPITATDRKCASLSAPVAVLTATTGRHVCTAT
jgi:hypothetical protein